MWPQVPWVLIPYSSVIYKTNDDLTPFKGEKVWYTSIGLNYDLERSHILNTKV